MGNSGKRDLARQAATVVGALFQVLAGAIVPIGAIAKETPSLVIPTDYAFAISRCAGVEIPRLWG